MTTYTITTLGCKVNQNESDAISSCLRDSGFIHAKKAKDADVCIINTCAVTGKASMQSRQAIRKIIRMNPNARIIVTGCYSQVASQDVLELADQPICIVGNENKHLLVDIALSNKMCDLEMYMGDIGRKKEICDLPVQRFAGRTRAYLKIQDGCNNFCSYCAIPHARGRSRSRKPGDVIKEAEHHAKNGTVEIVLTGIHLDSYGKDLGSASLVDLLESLDEIEGIERIRLGSLEPASINPDFVKRVSNLKKLCPHFHLSLQSGCDSTLQRMKRRYNTTQYRESADLIKKHIEDVAITTDIIAGFPGETEEEFNETYEFAESIGFMKIHVFPFSARKGTLAYGMPDKVPGEIKKERSAKLIELSNRGFEKFTESMIGKSYEILMERESAAESGYWEGHTPNYIKALVECSGCVPGTIHRVVIQKTAVDCVYSSMITGTGI